MRLLIEARNAAVGVEDGRIVAAEGRFDRALSFPRGEVRPGLINAHDHLHRNHYGRLGRPPYRNAYQWAHDIQQREHGRIARGRRMPRREALLVGARKNLLAGVTTVVHHDRWEDDFDAAFPIRIAEVANADSLGMTPDLAVPASGPPFALHLAEGVDRDAAAEVREADARGVLTADLIAVHCVGVDQDGIGRLRTSGAAITWCPSSNLFLFGRTAPAGLLAPGMDLMIGSDSLLTGAGDLLDELRIARRLDMVDDRRLSDAVGRTAAHRLGLPEPGLEEGKPADIAVFEAPLLDASARHVALVLVDGVPQIASRSAALALGDLAADGCMVRIGTLDRWLPAAARSQRPFKESEQTCAVIA